jgi:uncharacterized DUF497 family protein
MSHRFEWDTKKAKKNLSKHEVSFEEAMTVFRDPLARIFDDETHSKEERREILVGHSEKERLLLVSFVNLGEILRLLSARRATRQERKDYEENVGP